MDLNEKKCIVSIYKGNRDRLRKLLIVDLARELTQKIDEVNKRKKYELYIHYNHSNELDCLIHRMREHWWTILFNRKTYNEAVDSYDKTRKTIREKEVPFNEEINKLKEELTYKEDLDNRRIPQRIRDFDNETFTKIKQTN